MAAYWFLFGIWAAGAIQFARRRIHAYDRFFYIAAATFTALMIGLRYQVGGDWGSYVGIYDDIYFQPITEAVRRTDPGYGLFNWLSAQGNWGIGLVNLGCSILFTGGLARLAWRQPNPWLAILVAVPYLIIVVAMGYTRQAAAIGIICWALADASSDKILRLVVLIGLAALFHKTAILFLPILLVPIVARNFLVGAAGAVAFAILFNLFLGAQTDNLISNYVTSTYDSQGAGIRVGMNLLAAILMLVLRDRMGFDEFTKSFWTICSVLAVVSMAALFALSASSGVDRLSLFLIPLQVVTLSRLPFVLSRTSQPLPSALLGVIAYSFAVQFVWLNYADNAHSWIPYQTTVTAEGG